MAAPRWTLTNPANGAEYLFHINPTEEEDFGKRRNVEKGANTANTGFVLQQGDSGTLVLRAHGRILHKAQRDALNAWYALCDEQTVRLEDHEGNQYLGIITEFITRRKKTVRNPRDFANAPLWYWEYDFSFEIVTVLVEV